MCWIRKSLIGLTLGIFLATNGLAATYGPNSPSIFSNDDSVGTVAWTNPENAASSDDVDADVSPTGYPVSSYYLKACGFNFSIPYTERILGVLVEFEKDRQSTASFVDNSVVLWLSYKVSVDDKATGDGWPNADTYISHGGSTDTWGQELTPAHINKNDFCTMISATQDSDPDRTASIDHIRVTVYTETITVEVKNSTLKDSIIKGP